MIMCVAQIYIRYSPCEGVAQPTFIDFLLPYRNCLLCDNNIVKITDVAMGISLFNSDYSEVRGRSCAPIRWQPWETLLLVKPFSL